MRTFESNYNLVTLKQARKAQFEIFKNQYTDHEELREK